MATRKTTTKSRPPAVETTAPQPDGWRKMRFAGAPYYLCKKCHYQTGDLAAMAAHVDHKHRKEE